VLKKTLIAVSTFFVAVLLFVIYQWHDETPTRRVETVPDERLAATQMASDAPRLRVQDVEVPEGEKPFVVVYDEQGRPRVRFRSEKWHPVTETEWHMTKPEVRLLLPGGEPIEVRADEGQVVVAREDNDNYDPKRGWLRGNVHIVIDRTDEAWRADHPDRARPEEHPEYVVHMYLDAVTFNLELAKLESEGPIRIESPEATVEGTGLTLEWNEVAKRIDYLEIRKGKRITVSRNAGLVEIAMPGSARTRRRAEEATAPATQPAVDETIALAPDAATKPAGEAKAASETSEAGFEDVFFDVTRSRRFRRRNDQKDTYKARFEGGVRIAQRRGEAVIGSLEADVLEVLFDFGAKQREAADVRPPDSGEGALEAGAVSDARGASAATKPAASPEPEDSTRIALVWTGKLTLKPLEVDPKEQGERLHAVATGHVRLRRDEGEAECDRLEFHNETQQAWLRGSPARLRQGPEREVTGPEIFYDPGNGLARVDGPGTMTTATASSGRLRIGGVRPAELMEMPTNGGGRDEPSRSTIRWSEGVALTFGLAEREETDSATGETVIRQNEYLKRALIRGDVAMTNEDGRMAADTIDFVFAEPPSAGATTERIDHVTAEGHVEVSQGERRIRGDDRLNARFGMVPAPLDPVDPKKAVALLRARGVAEAKIDAIDWEAVNAKRANNQDQAVVYVEVFGNARAVDPDDELDVAGDEIRAWIPNGRSIERSTIVGSERRSARVRQGDFYVRGPRVDLELKTGYAKVPGAGLLRFRSYEDLDGRKREEPVPVAISWQDQMELDGARNVGQFVGSVRAVSQDAVVDCRELHVRFADMPPAEGEAATTAPADRDFWLLNPLVRAMFEKDKDERGLTAASDELKKRPVYFLATGEAQALSTTVDPADRNRILSRMHVDGPEIAVDLETNQMTVSGAGHLLIEDYRAPKGAKEAKPRRRGGRARRAGPFGPGLEPERPSQTLFTWQNAMSYFVDRNLAAFDENVTMNHRSGSEIKLALELAESMKLDIDAIRQLRGQQASLRCDNLIVEFLRDPDARRREDEFAPFASATDIRHLRATGRVRLEQNVIKRAPDRVTSHAARSIEGELITFNRVTNLIRVFGSPDMPARFINQDERTGRFTIGRGERVTYNVETGVVDADSVTFSSTGS
jgi:hypothetical protein